MNEPCGNNYATVIYDNSCYFDKYYDNLLFVPNFKMHGNEKVCIQNVYDKALDDGPMLLDNIMYSITESVQSSCFNIVKSGFENFDPTILELDKNYMFVDHEKHGLCDSYIVEFAHDATINYYERGTYGCRNVHVTKKPLFKMQVLKLLLVYLPTLVTMFSMDLFVYKTPMHRKWVRVKCISNFLLDAPFFFMFLS